MFKHMGPDLDKHLTPTWQDLRAHSKLPGSCLMVAAALMVLFRINWPCVNQNFMYIGSSAAATVIFGQKQTLMLHLFTATDDAVRSMLVHGVLIGPYLLPWQLIAQICWVFLDKKLPETYGSNVTGLWLTLYVRSDNISLPLHWSLDRWRWACSLACQVLDLTLLDFFLWGHIKVLIYTSPVDSENDLIAYIIEAAATIRQQPAILDCTRPSLLCRRQLFVEVGSCTFEHVL